MTDAPTMTSGLAAVQARINELQTLLAGRPAGPVAGSSGAGTSGGGTGSSSAAFATALQSALGGAAASEGSAAAGPGTDPSSTLSSLGSAQGSTLGSNLGTTIGTAIGTAISALIGSPARAGSPAVGSSGSTAADLGAQAVELAKQYTGVPYRWGGENPETGVDCSGLTQSVYATLGVTLPRVAADQARTGTAVASVSAAQPGDLVFFGSPAHHVGIYVGNGKMIDAPHTGSSVGVHPIWGTPSAIRRPSPVLPATRAAATVAVASADPVTGAPAAAPVTGPYADLFRAAGAKYGVDPALLSAVAKAESAYNPKAVSSAGAQGLMQLMPSTARSLGVDPYDPASAVDGAARMLSGLIADFGGRTDLAIAGYNAGSGAVHRYGGVPPYAETRTYVRRVSQYWEELR